jgi:hypothetical protein
VPGAWPSWGRLWKRFTSSGHDVPTEPLVSVIVPVHNVAEYVADCLDSVLAQDHRRLQVLVIDDGSSDSSPEIVRRYAAGDDRIVFRAQPNAGLGATRNRAVQQATGDYLFFLDSDDRLPKRAISTLVEAAERTGADVAMGPLTRFNSTRRWLPAWAAELHRAPEFHQRLTERPELLRNHYACAKLYRRSFWAGQDARFREGVAYEDQPLVTRLLLAADGIAAVSDPVYEYRDRDDQSSISQRTHTLADLQARTTAWGLARDVLADQPEPIRAAWLQTILGTHAHWYLDNDAISRPDYWQALRDGVRALDALGQPSGPLPPARELALELLRADDHAGYLELRRRGALLPDRQRVVVVGDRFWWQPQLDDPSADDPRRPLSDAQVGSRVVFDRARWTAGPALLVGGSHTVSGLDAGGLDVRPELVATGPAGSRVFAAETVPNQECSFAAVLDGDALAALAGQPGELCFSVRSHFGGAVLERALPRPAKWFAARRLGPAVHAGLVLLPDLDAARFSLSGSPVAVWADRVETKPAGVVVGVRAEGVRVTALKLGSGTTLPVVDGEALVRMPAELAGRDRVEVPVTALGADGVERPLYGQATVGLPGGRVQLRPGADGALQLVAHQRHAELQDYAFGQDRLELRIGAFLAPGWALSGVRLRSREETLAAVRAGDGRWLAHISALPEGGYDLVAEFTGDKGVRVARVAATPAYLETVPTSVRVGDLLWRALVAPDGGVHFDAHPEDLTRLRGQ